MKSCRWLFLIALLALLTSGCSSFNRDYKAAGKSANSLEGAWAGVWKSESSGHTDKLRAIVKMTAPGEYEARFRAKYHTVLTFGYIARLKGEEQGAVYFFKGDADLGKLAGGVYTYEGTIRPGEFHSSYHSKYDHGTFDLRRPVK